MSLRTAGDEGRLAEVIEQDERARAPLEAVAKAVVRQLASQAASRPAQASLPVL